MPQTFIQVEDLDRTYGRVAGAMSTGTAVKVNGGDYKKENIDWTIHIIEFFHKQGHEFACLSIAPSVSSAYPEDVEKMRLARRYYVDELI